MFLAGSLFVGCITEDTWNIMTAAPNFYYPFAGEEVERSENQSLRKKGLILKGQDPTEMGFIYKGRKGIAL